jgi:hypothetical protein
MIQRLEPRIIYNHDDKFDIQLSQSAIDTRQLGDIFLFKNIGPLKFELKTERWLWRDKNRIAVEYKRFGKPSGISKTEADYWVHELRWSKNAPTLCYIMCPMPVWKDLTRAAIRRGDWMDGAGDEKASHIAFIYLIDLLTLYDPT